MNREVNATALALVLLELPTDTFVACNDVGNLAVYSNAGTYLGYIDFRTADFCKWGDE